MPEQRGEDSSKHESLDMSVVVVILGGPAYVPRVLDRLLNQTGDHKIEILVPFDDRASAVEQLGGRYPDVQFLHLSGDRSYADLRAFAVRKSRGPIVAITEDHCLPAEYWCSAILAEHQNPHAAVGGPVDKYEPDTVMNWAIYLSDFNRYTSPVAEGPSEYLTDVNVTYKRSALDAIGDVWTDEFHETSVNWALRDRGESLWLSSKVLVLQQRSLRLGPALRERFSFGRLFASTRVAAVNLPKRIVYALLSCLLPPLFVMRVARSVFGKRRYIPEFVRALTAILLLACVWALGEFVGYLTGSAGKVVALYAEGGGATELSR